jgi:hypothetical protein
MNEIRDNNEVITMIESLDKCRNTMNIHFKSRLYSNGIFEGSLVLRKT